MKLTVYKVTDITIKNFFGYICRHFRKCYSV